MKDILTYKVVRDVVKILDRMYKMGWDERNGGNVSYLLDENELREYLDINHVIREYPINFDAKELAGRYFLMTGTGKYFRNAIDEPDKTLGVVRVSENGLNAQIIWGFSDGGRSTSETYAHLMCHIARLKVNPNNRLIMHCHPTNLLAMTHIHELNDKSFTVDLWRVMTECVVVFPDGIGILPWMLCGTYDIGKATADKMKECRLVVWSLHGIYGAGETIDEAFGLIETVEKAAEVYLKYAGLKEINTITNHDLMITANLFNITPKKGYID